MMRFIHMEPRETSSCEMNEVFPDTFDPTKHLQDPT